MTTSQPQSNKNSVAKPLESEEKASKKKGLRLQTDPFIFFVSGGFIVAFVALTLAFGERARNVYSVVSG